MLVDGLQVDSGFELILRGVVLLPGVFVLESRNSEHIARVHIAEVNCMPSSVTTASIRFSVMVFCVATLSSTSYSTCTVGLIKPGAHFLWGIAHSGYREVGCRLIGYCQALAESVKYMYY
jgi:hypothetical protein